MDNSAKINCPKCGHEFNVEDVLARQIEAKYREELNTKITELTDEYEEQKRLLSEKENRLKLQQAEIDSTVEAKVKEEAERREIEIAEKLKIEYDDEIASLKSDAEKSMKEVRELKNAKIENEQLKRKLSDQKQDLELEYETKLTERLNDATIEIQNRESEKVTLKLKEREEIIESLKKQVDEMQRKAEQGSMQMQGEVQELAIEELLVSYFPFDVIKEVGKGVKGADVIQTVRNKYGEDCGKILFESKRTKSFSLDWVSKLKADAVTVKADICVIVTETMPADIDRIGQKDGVWICSFVEFKGLILVLRESLIRINEAFSSQANKGEKMQMLYDYLLSNEFRLQVGAIIDGFTALQDGYVKEKRAMERIWKEREKQLEKVLLNTNHFIGSIKGIAGSSIENLKLIGEADNLLELHEDVEVIDPIDK